MTKVPPDKDIYINNPTGVGGNGAVTDDPNVDNPDYGLYGPAGGLLTRAN